MWTHTHTWIIDIYSAFGRIRHALCAEYIISSLANSKGSERMMCPELSTKTVTLTFMFLKKKGAVHGVVCMRELDVRFRSIIVPEILLLWHQPPDQNWQKINIWIVELEIKNDTFISGSQINELQNEIRGCYISCAGCCSERLQNKKSRKTSQTKSGQISRVRSTISESCGETWDITKGSTTAFSPN